MAKQNKKVRVVKKLRTEHAKDTFGEKKKKVTEFLERVDAKDKKKNK